VLARQIKTRIEESLEPNLGDLAALAGRLRDVAAARLSPARRRALWSWVFSERRVQPTPAATRPGPRV
jgi:uroporphyrin-III C-methyltransferase/precorrin-2 dehydrogenase/sirohydrochlorin ferrochelatase